MNQHTKGEWQIAEGTFIYCLNSGGENRFYCGIQAGRDEYGKRTSVEELEANAHLIAAAPDMYEALKAIKANFANELRITDADFGYGMFIQERDLKKYIGAIDEVLAKAEGEEQK